MGFNWKDHDVCYTNELGGYIALEPRKDGKTVSWFDLSHARAFVVKVELLNKPDHYAFKDSHGRRFDLQPITLDAWHSFYKKLSPTNRRFKTLGELVDALRNVHVY